MPFADARPPGRPHQLDDDLVERVSTALEQSAQARAFEADL
ncbi:hypothetical protein ACIGBL_01770 [Streptomyces sp. NPDC085614]